MALNALAGPQSPVSTPVSERYVRTALDMQPMAQPVQRRPMMSCAMLYELPWSTELTMAMLPRMTLPLRPMREAKK